MTKDELEELEDEELVELWNKFCENTNMFEDTIYPMDELDDVVGKMYPTDLVDEIDFNNFSENDCYFSRIGYGGYIESFDTPYEVIDEEALLEWYNANLT